jgi:hypothetical protein
MHRASLCRTSFTQVETGYRSGSAAALQRLDQPPESGQAARLFGQPLHGEHEVGGVLEAVRVGNVVFVTTRAVAQELRQEAPAPVPSNYRNRLGEIDSFLAPPAPVIVPGPPPGVPPAVPPVGSGDRK